MRVYVKESRCISCGACVVLCPAGAISLHGGAAHVDPGLCCGCMRCIPRCYMRAFSPAPDGAKAQDPLSER